MHTIINHLISGIKKQDYEIDPFVPFLYLVRLILMKSIMLMRGFFIFGKPFVFVGDHTKIVMRRKIHIIGACNIGAYCYIDSLSIKGIELGENASIGRNTTIECTGSLRNVGLGMKIGANVGLGTHGFFGCAGGIEIGDDTIFGNFVSLHSENHNYSNSDTPIRLQGVNRKGIKIGKNCWIGAKATILDGAIIGDGCIIAAGSVVLAGVYKDNSIYGGVPAKYLKPRIV